MEKFKGTKGEWAYRSQPIKQLGFYIETIDKSHKNTFIGEVGGGLQSNLEIKANAILISKAPEMLEMLGALTNTINKLDKASLNSGTQSRLMKLVKDSEQLIKSATEL